MPLGANKAALLGASAGGFSASGGTETEYTDGGVDYKVHSFLTSSTLVIEGAGSGVNMDILIVAGGGGSGGGSSSNRASGGGGGGGMLYELAISFTDGTYTVTVGAGADCLTPYCNTGAQGNNGANSVVTETTWGTATSIGGGGGGAPNQNAVDTGGSGGGAGSDGSYSGGTAQQSASNGIDGFGNNGGSTTSGGNGPSGGGAGSAGSVGGYGLGKAITIRTGASVLYAAGGNYAEGHWGQGVVGAANTGNGGSSSGSGGGSGTRGAAGGSGIVVLRYAV
jgi:hypothetical protein